MRTILPRVSIIGRPNVGKSTLFNRLVGARIAITDGQPGVTRDMVLREAGIGDRRVLLVDTGGIGEGEEVFRREVSNRSVEEIAKASMIVLVVDVTGLTPEDEEVIQAVRRAGRPVVVAVNKVDSDKRSHDISSFWELGFERLIPVSAEHGLGIDDLTDEVASVLDDLEAIGGDETEPGTEESDSIVLAIVGRPNTGKSSLLNYLAGEERALVSPVAGTTRDTLDVEFQFKENRFRILDTAGLRRKARVSEAVEYYAVQRALTAIEGAELVVLMVDAQEGLSEQDKKIASRISDLGRGVVVALNKWDLLDSRENQLEAMQDRIHFVFPVFRHVPILPISAKTGEGVEDLLKRLLHIRGELHRRIDTGPLNQALQRWTAENPPPGYGKRPFKVKFITQVQTNPVRFMLFVNRTRGFPESYVSYIRNRIRSEFGYAHIPFFLQLRSKR